MPGLTLKNKNIYTLFFILTFLFYGNSLKNKYALDDEYITVTNFPEKGKEFIPNHNLVSKGFKGIAKIWKSKYAHDSEGAFDYRPLTTTTFAIEYGLFGQNPIISHLVNILLYFITICLLFKILLTLFREYKDNFSVAFFCTLLFLIHPIHTEVVNNLKCRDEILAFLCSLIALWFTLESYTKPTFKNIFPIFIFLVLAIFSKRTAVLFFAIIPLCLLFFRTINIKKIIYLILSIGIVLFITLLIKNNVISEKSFRNFYHFENPLYTDKVSIIHRLIIGVKTFGFYVKLLIFPFPFRNYYGTGTFDLSASINLYFILGISFMTSCTYFIYKFRNKYLLFSTLLFCGSILPFVNIGSPAPGILAERFAYLPSFGFCLIIAIIIVKYLKFNSFNSFSRLFTKPLIYLIPLVFICMIYIWNRNSNWYNKIVLFEHDIKYLEKSAKANSLLANEYFEMLRTPNKKYSDQVLVQKSLKYYNQAINNDSSFFTAYNNAGVIHFSYLNDISLAKKYFKLAIRHRPLYSQAYENLGNCYKRENNNAKAFECYKTSIILNPKQYSAYMGAISMFFEKKEFDKSLKIIKTANLNFPNNYELTAQAANCYLMKKDTVTALTKYEEAYSIFPNQELAQFLSKKYEESGDSAKSNFYKKTQQIN